MGRPTEALVEAALRVLNTADPFDKARLGDEVATSGSRAPSLCPTTHHSISPCLTAPPGSVKLVPPGLMPKLGKAGSLQSRQAIVHSLVHTESWAIDLSWVGKEKDKVLGPNGFLWCFDNITGTLLREGHNGAIEEVLRIQNHFSYHFLRMLFKTLKKIVLMLIEVLGKVVLGYKWIDLIWFCISTRRFYVMLSCIPSDFFQSSMGFRSTPFFHSYCSRVGGSFCSEVPFPAYLVTLCFSQSSLGRCMVWVCGKQYEDGGGCFTLEPDYSVGGLLRRLQEKGGLREDKDWFGRVLRLGNSLLNLSILLWRLELEMFSPKGSQISVGIPKLVVEEIQPAYPYQMIESFNPIMSKPILPNKVSNLVTVNQGVIAGSLSGIFQEEEQMLHRYVRPVGTGLED
ncbi:hypothetical protein CK203_048924 [Vitis vinifera]|uniref:Uncharacterized protein n=1 Tax=Vitis vinifera TaxID=29760 RepID=A0A438GVK0_VITVI|nr:hypothetical protein CK203_048924 [Vitis vinifera]